jgi:FkbM family methyltransferase
MTKDTKAQLRARFPGLAVAYKRTLRPLLQRRGAIARLDRWVAQGERITKSQGIEGVAITRGRAWLQEPDGYEWLYLPGSSSMLTLKEGRGHEREQLELLSERLRAGDTLLDVGANIGYMSIRLAKGNSVKVVAIEPVPDMFNALQANIARNDVASLVTPIQSAAMDSPGTVHVTVDRGPANHLSADVPGSVAVPARRLDELDVAPTAIKCDVEGAELPALKGAEGLLASKPPLLVEVEERWTSRFGYSSADLFDYLSGLGYRPQMVLPTGLEPGTDVSRTNSFWFE